MPLGSFRVRSKRAVGAAIPFEPVQLDLLLGPNGRNVGVGEIGQAQIGPDRLGHIDDDVAGVIPRREDADLGFALRSDGAVEEPDPRMTAARIGQHQEGTIRGPFRFGRRRDIETPQPGRDLRLSQPRGGTDFRGREAVVPDHVFEPVTQVGIVGRPAKVGWFSFGT